MERLKTKPNSFGRKAATAAVSAIAILGAGAAVKGSNTPNTTNPVEVAATKNLLANPESAEYLEGVIIVKSGANIRTTPERSANTEGPNDGQATEKSVNNVIRQVPAGKSLIVSRGIMAGDGFVGFTLPTNPVEDGDSEVEIAKKTFYVDFAELENQGLAEFVESEPVQTDIAASTQPELDARLFVPTGEFVSNAEVATRVNTLFMPAD